MLNRIFQSAAFATISIVLSLIVFAGWATADGLEQPLSPEANGDNPLGIVIEQSKTNQGQIVKEKKVAMDEKALNELIGEDPIFPFQP